MTTAELTRETDVDLLDGSGSGDDWLPPRHPLLACADNLDEALRSVAEVDPAYLPANDRREALLRFSELAGRLEELRLRLVAGADEVAKADGHAGVASWLAQHRRTDRRVEAADVRLARALEQRWSQVAAALRDGAVNPAQARVIVASLEDLPESDVPDEVLERAEAHLVAEAARFGPRELRLLGRRVLEVIAPEHYDAQEAKALQREEARAARRTTLFTRRYGDGTTQISARVPDAVASRLLTYLDAFASPRGPAQPTELGEKVPHYARLGHAFAAFLEAVDPRRMPLHGGDATTVLVTIKLDDLRRDLGSATLGANERLSAGEVRRLACTARLVPAVLGTDSEVLDLGRSARLFSPAQRRAMAIRDRTCRAEGCDIPAAWCEAHHHRQPWAAGGRTDLDGGVLLCSWHHHRAHDHAYRHERLANGDLRFHRRK